MGKKRKFIQQEQNVPTSEQPNEMNQRRMWSCKTEIKSNQIHQISATRYLGRKNETRKIVEKKETETATETTTFFQKRRME